MTLRTIHKLTAATLLGALALGGCGIKGQLKTPPPVWGDKSQKSAPQDGASNFAHQAKNKSDKRKQK